jgi:crotonobetainyl-CoA:carnitine CoA-transferase CaiB-like acyl-CoA transferase
VGRLTSFLGNPFSFLFARPTKDERIAAYVIREHDRGRRLDEIIEDPYIRNRATAREIARMLERPEVIEALGHATVAETQERLA